VILLKSKVLTVGTPDEVLQSEEFRQVFLKPLGKEGNG
jgi:ABC-type lipopolysaccharide export system ATPase subunit